MYTGKVSVSSLVFVVPPVNKLLSFDVFFIIFEIRLNTLIFNNSKL